MKRNFADLERLVEAAEVAEPEHAPAAWAAAAARAEVSEVTRTADGAYLLGYVLYQLGSSAPGGLERAEQLLRSALNTEPNHAYARLYLGHIAFDAGSFSEALSHFDELKNDAFSRKGQAWRDLKIQELRICCLLQLRQVAHLTDEFERLLQLASRLEVTDTLVVHELPKLLQAKFGCSPHAA
jgi:tetratricopeptide (TPR) repeat protein